jgi:hypothetical protein
MSRTEVTVTDILLPLNKVVLHFLWLCAILRLAIPSDPVVFLTHRGDMRFRVWGPTTIPLFNCIQYSNLEDTCSKRPLNCKWQFFQSPLDDTLDGSLFHPCFYCNMLLLDVWLTQLWMNPNFFHCG